MATDIMVNKVSRDILEDFSDIKGSYKLSDKEYENALKFSLLISEGKNKVDAYVTIFGDKGNKSINGAFANKYIRTKVVSNIIDRLIAGNHIIFSSEHYQALEELFNIGMEGQSEKNRVEALKAFLEITKRPEPKGDAIVNINLGSEITLKLEEQLKQLADRAKMITNEGNIIDVEEI